MASKNCQYKKQHTVQNNEFASRNDIIVLCNKMLKRNSTRFVHSSKRIVKKLGEVTSCVKCIYKSVVDLNT